MDYPSVQETANKFNLYERGIQNFLSLKEVCEILSISTATGRNWIKLGKIMPEYAEKKTPYFRKDYILRLKSNLESGENTALKSRRNKKFISGNTLYNSYVSNNCKNIDNVRKMLETATAEIKDFDSNVIQYIVADCAINLFVDRLQLSPEWKTHCLEQFLNGTIDLQKHNPLIAAFIDDPETALEFCQKHPAVFSFIYSYETNEDILGLIYLSCQNIGNRKATGAYYTPTNIVKKLISGLDITESDRILDPCCGTGNFLLQLPSDVDFDNVFGNDLDPVSVKITRLNMALRYPDQSTDIICTHITEQDYLTEYDKTDFHYIIGNPPWGYNFSEGEKERLRKKYKSASGKNIESYDVFIECALQNITTGGQLSFVLPEAILNVKAHSEIREIILSKSSIRQLDFLGNAFDNVQCPCIIMQLQYTDKPLSTMGLHINSGQKEYEIKTERAINSEYFSFAITDEEYQILKKIRNKNNISYLSENADFALGIVTGNNKEYISSQKTPDNEMILKGTDICKYHINPCDRYIVFQPESFQQVAPIDMYRAKEKLLYRFISNQLVFAYDDKQTLSLNSCNIVIPRMKDAKIKYILAILNSRVAQFIYKKEFNSIKVLRSHIENIPIPMVSESQQEEIIRLTEPLIQRIGSEVTEDTYDELDKKIIHLFDLSDQEYQIIKNATDEDNKHLA